MTPKSKDCITMEISSPKITDKEKLENTLQDMLKGFQYFTSSTTAVIGKTKDQVITLTIRSRGNYENEFNESFDDISDKHICLSFDNSTDTPPGQ